MIDAWPCICTKVRGTTFWLDEAGLGRSYSVAIMAASYSVPIVENPAAPSCVICAAGRSSRMGAWKPLLPWPGGSVIGAVLRSVLDAGLRPVVVTGYRADELSAAFAGLPEASIVYNPAWERGMLGSVLAGLERARDLDGVEGLGSFSGCLVTHADMPLIGPGSYRAMTERSASRREAGLGDATLFPRYSGALGHPVWIPFNRIKGLSSLGPGERLRDFLLSGPWEAVDLDDEGIVLDLDTPEAYEASHERATRRAQ